YSIPGATLAPDRYSIRIVAWNKAGSEYLFTVGRFKVAKETKATDSETLQATSTEEINNQDVEESTKVQQTENNQDVENNGSIETSTTTDSTDVALRNFEVF